MNENLIKRQDIRQSTYESKRREKESNKIVSEDSDYRLQQINDLRDKIELKVDQLDSNMTKSDINNAFKELNSDYDRLSQYINESVLYLAKYNQKLCQTVLSSLRNKIDTQNDLLVPKSKFSFKSSFKTSTVKDLPKPKVETCDEIDSAKTAIHEMFEFIGFKNKSDCEEPLRMTGEECNLKDIHLDGITNCRIEIIGLPNTLKINNLTNCNVFCGPITTSIFISNCKNCVFNIAAQQLRLHTSSDCKIYLHVTSRAIIEESIRIGFAPYDWTYDGIEEDFKRANLDINTNNWQQIDDFDCLSTDNLSKNWYFIDLEN
ncbi:tubulin-specific chaperone C-like [Oppia nitens]|uniref:tubulin-specific chaperone C-like n=1 Tax=Oppia nitens TaxID=1686743 RepID=UPI0023DACC5B|nr:tubulin-specific chaperone C-like [Oppia nitens]